MKSIKRLLFIIFALLLVSQTATAQTYIPPSLGDSLLATEDSLVSISCDMLESPVLGGTLFVVGYSYQKGTGYESWLHLKYIHTNGDTINWDKRVPNAYNLDVVLGDNKLTPGSRYNVFYVYNEHPSGNVRYSRYTIGYSSTPALFSVNNGGGAILSTNGNSPKVDIFPDARDTFSNGTPKMYDFVATWSNSTDTMNLATGYVNAGGSIVTYKIPGFELAHADVGAQFDLDSQRYVGHLTYRYKSLGALAHFYHAAINMSVTPR